MDNTQGSQQGNQQNNQNNANPFQNISGFPPQGAFNPPAGAGFNPGGMIPQPPVTQPPTDDNKPKYTFGKMLNDFKTNIKLPSHNLKFDEVRFLRLLAGSISLTKDEKVKIIKSLPKLSQFQIDELMKILEEEQEKFTELSEKHGEQLEKLERKHVEDWHDIEAAVVAEEKAKQDQSEADEIRKKLGL